MIDLDLELPLITFKDPLERDFMGHDIFGDADTNETVQLLDVASIPIQKGRFEPLNRPLAFLLCRLLIDLLN